MAFAECYKLEFDSRSDADCGASQGVAFDGAHYYTTAGSAADSSVNTHIRKWTRSGDTFTQDSERDTSGDWPSGMAQINSIWYDAANGRLVIGGNNYPTASAKGWVLEYDPSDLSHIATHAIDDFYSEGGAKHPGNGLFYAVFHDSLQVISYDPASSWAQDTVHDSSEISATYQVTNEDLYQGAAWTQLGGADDFLAVPHEDSDPEAVVDVYRLSGGVFSLVTRLAGPSIRCTQDISGHPSDANTFFFAERFVGGGGSDHRILQATLSRITSTEVPAWDGVNTGSDQHTDCRLWYPCAEEQSPDGPKNAISDNYHGTLRGFCGWAGDATYGRVLRFFGSGAGWVAVPAALIPAAGYSEMCFSSWVKFDALNVAQIIISGNASGSNTGDWQFALQATGQLQFFYDNATILATASAGLTTGTFFHLAVRLTSSGARIYVNGVEKATNATTGQVGGASQDIRLGRSLIDTEGLRGEMRDVRLYPAARTAAFVEAMHDADTRYDLWTADTGEVTATAALAVGAATLSGSAEFDAPTFSGSASLAAPAAELAGAAEFDAPVFAAAAALIAPPAELAASATFTDPVYEGAPDLSAPAALFSGAAEFDVPVYTGAASLTVGAATFSGSATYFTYQATAALVVGAATLAASATFVEIVAITAAARMLAADVYASGIVEGEVYASGIVDGEVYASGIVQGQIN